MNVNIPPICMLNCIYQRETQGSSVLRGTSGYLRPLLCVCVRIIYPKIVLSSYPLKLFWVVRLSLSLCDFWGPWSANEISLGDPVAQKWKKHEKARAARAARVLDGGLGECVCRKVSPSSIWQTHSKTWQIVQRIHWAQHIAGKYWCSVPGVTCTAEWQPYKLALGHVTGIYQLILPVSMVFDSTCTRAHTRAPRANMVNMTDMTKSLYITFKQLLDIVTNGGGTMWNCHELRAPPLHRSTC